MEWNILLSRIVAMGLVLAGIGASSPPESHLAEIKSRGNLVMLSFPHQESAFVRTNVVSGPMRRIGTANGFQGIDVDLMKAFAESLGVRLDIRPVSEPSYGALIPDLLAGKGDLIASSFTITAERKQKVDFSDPYYSVYPVILTRVGSPIAAVADLAGKRAAAIPGSSQEEHLRELGVASEKILAVDFRLETYTAVMDGEADFTLADSSSAMRFLHGYPKLRIAFRLPGEDEYGFAVPRGSDLREALNRFLAEMKTTGALERIIRRHMSPDDARADHPPAQDP